MTDSAPSSHNEIDLFELIQVLWDGKYLIAGITLICAVLAGVYTFVKTPNFISKVVYSTDTVPPFYDSQKPLNDFKDLFYLKETFVDWREQSGSSRISFDNFSESEVVDGIALKRKETDQLALISNASTGAQKITIRSGDLALLNDFYEYAEYITQLLKEDYVARARAELAIYEARFDDLKASNQSVIQNVLSIDRYIVTAEKGANVIAIKNPTRPKKVSPTFFLILAMSSVLGGMVGVFFIIVRNAINKRKEQLAKA